MNILHLITTINRGGAENHLFALASEQLRQGLTVHVAYLKGNGYWYSELSSNGCYVYNLDLKYYGDLKPIYRLRKIINNVKPMIVHAHMPPAELYFRLTDLLTDFVGSYIVTKHNDEPFFSGIGSRFVGKWCYTRADRVISISSAVKSYTLNTFGKHKSHIANIPYGIDIEPYCEACVDKVKALRHAWKISPNTFLIGTVARLVPQKAIHILLRSFALFLSETKADSSLVVVGQGPLRDELRKLTFLLGISESVVWAGFREDIPVVMQALDCFALTSQYEGFGLVLLEAMAAGLPIIATEVSAIPEIVYDKYNGYLCPAGDIKAIAEALSKMNDPSIRTEFGNRASAQVKKMYSLKRMIESTISLYSESIGDLNG